jgi:hypothetical protein
MEKIAIILVFFVQLAALYALVEVKINAQNVQL